MIHDGYYYIIIDKEIILLLLDDIDQKIIWFAIKSSYDTILCSLYLWVRILKLQHIWR